MALDAVYDSAETQSVIVSRHPHSPTVIKLWMQHVGGEDSWRWRTAPSHLWVKHPGGLGRAHPRWWWRYGSIEKSLFASCPWFYKHFTLLPPPFPISLKVHPVFLAKFLAWRTRANSGPALAIAILGHASCVFNQNSITVLHHAPKPHSPGYELWWNRPRP